MLTKDELPECPVATTVQLIGSKWKLLIIRNLLERPWRFNELKKNLEGISQKVLTDSLRAMEEDGIITRTVYPEVPPRVEYALSDLGESMRPILTAMQEWGDNYKSDLSFLSFFKLFFSINYVNKGSKNSTYKKKHAVKIHFRGQPLCISIDMLFLITLFL